MFCRQLQWHDGRTSTAQSDFVQKLILIASCQFVRPIEPAKPVTRTWKCFQNCTGNSEIHSKKVPFFLYQLLNHAPKHTLTYVQVTQTC